MRKLIIAPVKNNSAVPNESWLNLEDIATVEITSEEIGFPVEAALGSESDGKGWRAARAGTQTIQLIVSYPESHLRAAERSAVAVSRIWATGSSIGHHVMVA